MTHTKTTNRPEEPAKRQKEKQNDRNRKDKRKREGTRRQKKNRTADRQTDKIKEKKKKNQREATHRNTLTDAHFSSPLSAQRPIAETEYGLCSR